MKTPRRAEDILAAISEAFRTRSAAKIAEQFSDDGIFVNAVGDLAGDTYKGPAEVRRYFDRIFSETPDVAWIPRDAPIIVGGDQAITQWYRRATNCDGTILEWYGVDIYSFQNGMITKKDTYVKNVTR